MISTNGALFVFHHLVCPFPFSSPLRAGARRLAARAAGDVSMKAPASAAPHAAMHAVDLEHARALYMQEKFDEAQAVCEELLRRSSVRTDVLLLLGACCYQRHDTHNCIHYNRQAIALDANFPEAYSNMANAYKELGELETAIELYRKATSLNPKFVDALINLAATCTQKEMYTEAIDAYERALAINPNLPDAQCSLGNLLKHKGDRAGAKRCYTNAIRLRPGFAVAWNNLAGTCKDDDDLQNAISCYREALRLNPDMADASSNLGNALKESGFLDEAIAAYNQALRLRPDFAITLGNLASVYYEKRELSLAVQTYRRAVWIQPNFPDAHNNLGNALKEMGQLDEAIESYRTAIRQKPTHQHAFNNLGNAMKDKGKLNESMLCYQMAIQISPNFAAAYSNLASLFKDKGSAYLNQALMLYLEAIRIDPYFADAYSNLANAYRDSGDMEQAIRMYQTAVALKPNFAEVHSYLASTYKDVGRIADAIACYRKALQLKPWFPEALCNLVHTYQFISDWSEHTSNMRALEHCLDRQLAEGQCPSMQPFHAFMYPLHLSKVKRLSQAYAQRSLEVAQTFRPPRFTHPPLDATLGARPGGPRLKVGYVSSDFCNHPLGHLMQSVFGMHDSSRLEVYCYSLRKDDGSVFRKTIQNAADHFRDVAHLDSLQIAQQIHADGIHVLINLNGYTKGGRNEIFAMRPCGVQMLYMGFPGTMGADFIDYLVTDRSTSPPELAWVYHEKLLWMPNSYFCNDHRQSFNGPHCRVLPPEVISSHFVAAAHNPSHPPLASYEWYSQAGRQSILGVRETLRRQHELPPFAILFCCFNQLYKLEPSTFSCWCQILKAVPNSALWLLRFPALCVPHLYNAAAQEGIPKERLIFSNVASKAAYIARASLADIFLDTPMCNGHTTGCDVLWAGVPIVTCQLESMCSRVAGSLCHAAGMPEMVCADMGAYTRLAITLGNDREQLLSRRCKLWASRLATPLFNTRRWTAEWDGALVAAWQRHCRGLPADHLASPPLTAEEEARVAQLNDADEAARQAIFAALAQGLPVEPGRIGQPIVDPEEQFVCVSSASAVPRAPAHVVLPPPLPLHVAPELPPLGGGALVQLAPQILVMQQAHAQPLSLLPSLLPSHSMQLHAHMPALPNEGRAELPHEMDHDASPADGTPAAALPWGGAAAAAPPPHSTFSGVAAGAVGGALAYGGGVPLLPQSMQPVLPVPPGQPLQLFAMQQSMLSLPPQGYGFGQPHHIVPATPMQQTAEMGAGMLAGNQIVAPVGGAMGAFPLLAPAVALQQPPQPPQPQHGMFLSDVNGARVLVFGQPQQPHLNVHPTAVSQLPALVPLHPA
ncbi:hypothetical protein AB1Y20_018583 [Prymnesium parvum]|uniref:Probable UDP-N-acetylglucosamine--peptide N-acetylglucosaminyltransferase SPINDLY n=1 Tax=Prymnesium parvum TaxID=97485 RepID=A0AB34JRU7_PRYPA